MQKIVGGKSEHTRLNERNVKNEIRSEKHQILNWNENDEVEIAENVMFCK